MTQDNQRKKPPSPPPSARVEKHEWRVRTLKHEFPMPCKYNDITLPMTARVARVDGNVATHLQELDALVRKFHCEGNLVDIMPTLISASRAVEALSYKMRHRDAIRALELFSQGSTWIEGSQPKVDSQHPLRSQGEILPWLRTVQVMRGAMQVVLASSVARLPEADTQLVADMMTTMVMTRSGRQEFLDAMLARFLALLRSRPNSFTPPVCARMMYAIGSLQLWDGHEGCHLSPRHGASDEGRASNQRFINAFNSRLVLTFQNFLEEDLCALHESYCADYLGEEELRRLLYRAAQLQVGLLPGTAGYVSLWHRLVAAVFVREPLLAAEMPAFTRQYCDRLLASAPPGDNGVHSPSIVNR